MRHARSRNPDDDLLRAIPPGGIGRRHRDDESVRRSHPGLPCAQRVDPGRDRRARVRHRKTIEPRALAAGTAHRADRGDVAFRRVPGHANDRAGGKPHPGAVPGRGVFGGARRCRRGPRMALVMDGVAVLVPGDAFARALDGDSGLAWARLHAVAEHPRVAACALAGAARQLRGVARVLHRVQDVRPQGLLPRRHRRHASGSRLPVDPGTRHRSLPFGIRLQHRPRLPGRRQRVAHMAACVAPGSAVLAVLARRARTGESRCSCWYGPAAGIGIYPPALAAVAACTRRRAAGAQPVDGAP